LLAELADLRGVSGDEGRVRDYLMEKLKGYRVKTTVDTIGNLLVHREGKSGRPRVMLAAHMDEVGLMITKINKNGMFKFETIGGIDSRILPAKRVLVGPEGLPGVIGVKPVHLQKENERNKPFDLETLSIDCGFSSREKAEKQVGVGDYASFDASCTALGDGYYRGKAFDDRAGCLTLLELLMEDNGLAFDAAFTVQEEMGVRGAMVAAYSMQPQIALALEATAAADTPDSENDLISTRLGAGPVISMMDRTILISKEMRNKLVQAAEKAKVAYQFRSFTGGGTDAGSISLSREGVQCAVLSVPCRYIHSPHSILNESDRQSALALIRAWLEMVQ